MLLNANEGTLTIYKDKQRMGVIKSGLAGNYCWKICLSDANGSNTTGDLAEVSITRGDATTDINLSL